MRRNLCVASGWFQWSRSISHSLGRMNRNNVDEWGGGRDYCWTVANARTVFSHNFRPAVSIYAKISRGTIALRATRYFRIIEGAILALCQKIVCTFLTFFLGSGGYRCTTGRDFRGCLGREKWPQFGLETWWKRHRNSEMRICVAESGGFRKVRHLSLIVVTGDARAGTWTFKWRMRIFWRFAGVCGVAVWMFELCQNIKRPKSGVQSSKLIRSPTSNVQT